MRTSSWNQTKVLCSLCLEGGIKFTCAIDVKTGAATVSANDDRVRFDQADGSEGSPSPSLRVRLQRGGGSYRVRYGNVDDRIYLWINNRVVEFDLPMTFRRDGSVLPQWSPSNPRDAEPLGIGAQNLSMSVDRLRVWRDIYYIGYPGVFRDNDYRNFSGSVRKSANATALGDPSGGKTCFAHGSGIPKTLSDCSTTSFLHWATTVRRVVTSRLG